MIRGRVSLQGWQWRVDLLRETVTASLDLSHGSNVMDGVRRNTRLKMACLPMFYPPCLRQVSGGKPRGISSRLQRLSMLPPADYPS